MNVEPYKCDNTKLLSECNDLHFQLIKLQENYESKIIDLKSKISHLQIQNDNLDVECNQLRSLIDPKQRKNRQTQMTIHKKPFISTTRSGEFLAKNTQYLDGNGKNCFHSTPCDCRLPVEHLSVETLHARCEHLKNQLEIRDREISRLNDLLLGGRSVIALAKDCCYNGISSLSTDVEQLQMEKSKLQKALNDALLLNGNADKKIQVLNDINMKLSNEIVELKRVALSVENDANTTLDKLHRKNENLKSSLGDKEKRINELESKLRKLMKQKEISGEKESIELNFIREKLEQANIRGLISIFFRLFYSFQFICLIFQRTN